MVGGSENREGEVDIKPRHQVGSPTAQVARVRHLPVASALAILALALAVCWPFLTVRVAVAASRPPGGRLSDPMVRKVDIAQPSIVRLATLYTGHITLRVCGQSITVPSGGGYTMGATGSGAFISANGDILTADHVVHVDRASLDDEFFAGEQSAHDIADAINNAGACLNLGGRITANDVSGGVVQYLGIPYSTSYSPPQHLAWMNTSLTGPLSGPSAKSFLEGLMGAQHETATLLESSSFEQNDLALLHVNLTDTPSIQLDNSTGVAVEDQLTVIGFPGNGDVTNNATDLLTPSVNNTTVSAIKQGDNGAWLIQVGGNVEHGDSGGPALDTDGHIVGIVSFGGSDSQGITAFLRSSNDAQMLISEAGINAAPGQFQRLWEQAFSDYAATYDGHWQRAANELNALATSYPNFGGIKPYRDYATDAAQTESPSGGLLSSKTIAEAAGVAALALAVVIVLVFVLQRVQRTKAKSRMVEAAAPYGPYGYFPYGTGGYPPPQPNGGYIPPGGFGYVPPQPWAAGAQSAATAAVSAPMAPNVGPYSATDRVSSPSWSEATGDTSFAQRQAGQPSVPTSADIQAGMGTLRQGQPGGPLPVPGSWPTEGWSGAPPQAANNAAELAQCVNGHPLRQGELYCAVCGAPQAANVPEAYRRSWHGA